jgi:hypothetical protein
MPIYALEDISPNCRRKAEVLSRSDGRSGRPGAAAEEASVWWGAVLRGDNDWITIGENSNVRICA